MRKEIYTLQYGRALAAVSVVLFHIYITFALPKYFGRQIFPIFGAGNRGVDYFFVISGFIVHHVHRAEEVSLQSTLRFLLRRSVRLFPALWVVLSLLFISYRIFPSLSPPGILNFPSAVSAYFAAPSVREPLLAAEWTLRHEVLFYCAFAIWIWRPNVGIVVAAGSLALSLLTLLGLVSDVRFAYIFSPYNILFAIGIAASVGSRRYTPLFAWFSLATGAILFSVFWLLVASLSLPNNASVAPVFGLGAGLLVSALAFLEQHFEWRKISALELLGNASYSVYLVNFAAISTLTKILASFPEAGHFIQLDFFAVLTCAIGIGIAFHLYVERPLIKVLSPLVHYCS